MRHTKSDLIQMQSLPLHSKILMTQQRIKAWYESWKRYEIYNTKTKKTRFITATEEPTLKENEYIDSVLDGAVYVSFSGGKDSTVLLDIVRKMYPDVEAVFVNTGLEYPEIQSFVKSFENVTILRPKMRFDEVIKKFGYPIISKEVSECIAQGKLALQTERKKYSYRLKKLLGTAKDKNGEKSIFNKEKYKPLLNVDFLISNQCCNIMKKKAHKRICKNALQNSYYGTDGE